MSDTTGIRNTPTTWFDCFPTEIILEIFNYLSFSDIIHSFFHLNQRLKDLLLIHIRYNNYLQLPTTDLHFWQQVLPIIGSHIHSLTIINDYPPWSLDAFSHLRSITVSSPSGLANGQLKRILEHQCFPQLHTLKIRNEIVFQPSYNRREFDGEELLFTKVLSDENNLQVFEYLPLLGSLHWRKLDRLTFNVSIRSLTLHLTRFNDIFTLIKYTTNLLYLNLQSLPPFFPEGDPFYRNDTGRILLKEFYVTFDHEKLAPNQSYPREIDFHQLTRTLQIFSLSLETLTLNFTNLTMNDYTSGNFFHNGIILEKLLLTPMIKLQKFSFYAKIRLKIVMFYDVLGTFANQFWFDRQWTVGLHHDNCDNIFIYTLPFRFNELHGVTDFHRVSFNDRQMSTNSSRLWCNITSLELGNMRSIRFNDLFRFIRTNMPNLSALKFIGDGISLCSTTSDYDSVVSNDKIEHIDVTLAGVTTVSLQQISMEKLQQCFINVLPNIKHLILAETELPPVGSELALILNQRIQRLEVNEYFDIQKLAEIDYSSLSNLQELRLIFHLAGNDENFNNRTKSIETLLQNFSRLKLLSIYAVPCSGSMVYSADHIFRPILNKLSLGQMRNNYEIKRCGQYLRFEKK